MNIWLWLIPVISAFIGWFTNWIAIKMLFHPRNPVSVLGITVQGIFPKRQQQFAQKLGKLVSEELLSFDEIANTISSPGNLEKVQPLIEKHIDHFLREKLATARTTSPLFDTPSYTRYLEAAYAAMIARHDAGLAPDHISIAS